MSGTKIGALKCRDTLLSRDEHWYKKMGSIGGKNSTSGGFACDKIGNDGLTGAQRAKIAGAKGGTISRRRKKV